MPTPTEQYSLPFPAPPEPVGTGCYRREIDGVLCDFGKDKPHRLEWCSDWGRVWELPLHRKNHGPSTYGHTDFYDTQE